MSFGGLTVTQLRSQGRKVAEVVPKEGATSWFDNWMIPSSSEKLATAEAFLDYIQRPNVQKQIAAVTGYGITNENAVDLVPKDYAEAYRLDDPGFIAELDYWKPTPRRQQYLDVLNAVIAA
jgi:spermidine/putrescine-binding protein